MSSIRISSCGNQRRLLLATSVSLSLVVAAHPALAQSNQPVSSNGDVATLNEVIVTATKRGAETIQNVPFSIQAVTADEIAKRGASDFNDFFHLVPGLSVDDTGPGDKRYIVRGIVATGPGTVGVYLDDAIITGENAEDGGGQQADVKLFDIDRVEVLKGPQGTTFGSSSLAGTIRYITNKPVFDTDSAVANAEMVSTQGAALGYQTDGALNFSVIPDRLAIRAAGFYTELPGYIDSEFGKGVNGELSKAGRLSARLAITDNLTLTVMASEQTTHQDSKSYFDLVDDNGVPLTGGYRQADVAQAPFDDNQKIYDANLVYKTSLGTFTATASSFQRDVKFSRDASIVAQEFLGLPYLGAGRSVIYEPKTREVDSYEARYASTFNGPLQILIGVFGQEEHRFYRSTWDTVNAAGVLDPANAFVLLDRTVGDRIGERAVFGELNYEILHNLKLTVGARYYDFSLNETSDAITGFGGSPGSGVGPPSHSSYTGIIPRYNLEYKVNAAVNTYVQVAKGFRAGGNNDQTAAALANVTIPAGFAPDSLWSYEAGVKTLWLNKRIFFNAAAYYIDWSNIQIQLETNGNVNGSNADFPYTGNGGGATVKGFEAELGGQPVPGLNISLNTNYNDAELSKTNPPPGSGNEGDRLPYVPLWSAAAVADYDFPLTSRFKGTFGGDLTYTGSRATDLNDTIDDYRPLRAYALVSLRAGIKGETWSAMLIADNVFNDQTVINYTSTITDVTPDQLYVSRPRTIILRVSKRF